MELSLTIIVCELLLVIVTKANDDAYAQWIIPSQCLELVVQTTRSITYYYEDGVASIILKKFA